MFSGVSTVILEVMKTAISIPDELFEAAERLAEQEGMSRSELYSTALRRYLRDRHGGSVTGRLDVVYDAEPSGLDPVVASLLSRVFLRDEW